MLTFPSFYLNSNRKNKTLFLVKVSFWHQQLCHLAQSYPRYSRILQHCSMPCLYNKHILHTTNSSHIEYFWLSPHLHISPSSPSIYYWNNTFKNKQASRQSWQLISWASIIVVMQSLSTMVIIKNGHTWRSKGCSGESLLFFFLNELYMWHDTDFQARVQVRKADPCYTPHVASHLTLSHSAREKGILLQGKKKAGHTVEITAAIQLTPFLSLIPLSLSLYKAPDDSDCILPSINHSPYSIGYMLHGKYWFFFSVASSLEDP